MLATFFSADVLQDADEVLHDGNINVICWVSGLISLTTVE